MLIASLKVLYFVVHVTALYPNPSRRIDFPSNNAALDHKTAVCRRHWTRGRPAFVDRRGGTGKEGS